MNPTRLLAYFDRISEAPDAIPRLRRFILDLAVRGKLVEQDPKDEPASELLKQIQTERSRLVKAGEIRKERPLPLVAEDEAPYSPPTGWAWVRIRQVTSDRGQVTPDKDFTYIDVTAINKEVGCVADAKVLSPLDAPSRARKMVRTGDVLYSCVRPYLLNIAVIEKDIIPLPIASTAFAVLNGFGLVLSKYLWIALRSPFMVECVEAKMRGQAYPAINDSDFAVLPLPLPPLAEQHRIVAKVDELMALCDRLEAAMAERENRRDRLTAASLDRLNNGVDAKSVREHARFHLRHLPCLTTRPEHIQQLRQTILNLAMRGKLVPQDPKDEPASELLKRIAKEKARLDLKHEVSPLVADEIPFVLQRGWSWSRIGEICSKTGSGSTPRGGQAVYKSMGIPFLRSQNVYDDGLRLDDVAYIDAATHARMGGTAVKPRDLLLNITGGSMGRCCRVPDVFGEANVSQHVAIIRTAWPGIEDFLHRLVLSPYFQAFIFDEQTGAGRGGLPKNRMDRIAVALPPLAEQRRIVAKVDELMALCDRLEAQLKTTQTESRRLLEATLHEALGKAA